jgi:RNA processing factor Prp31
MMPACNVKVMGGTKAAQAGLSGLERSHTGVFGKMEVVKSAPKKFQMQLVRMLASNAVKCARADYLGSTKELGLKLHR